MTKNLNEMTELDFDDPMDWVYEVRRRISEECGHDIDRIFERAAKWKARDEANGIRYVRLPIARRRMTQCQG